MRDVTNLLPLPGPGRMSQHDLLRACLSTSGLPVEEMEASWRVKLASLTSEQAELVALLVAAAYSNGATDAEQDALERADLGTWHPGWRD